MIETIQYEQLPVAYTMFLLSIRIQGKFNPFPKYILCWTAFNSIYTYLATPKRIYVQTIIERMVRLSGKRKAVSVPK